MILMKAIKMKKKEEKPKNSNDENIDCKKRRGWGIEIKSNQIRNIKWSSYKWN